MKHEVIMTIVMIPLAIGWGFFVVKVLDTHAPWWVYSLIFMGGSIAFSVGGWLFGGKP